MSARVQTYLLRQAGGLSKYYCSVNKAGGRVVFENNGKALWGCADRTASLNSRGVVYFTCLSGRSYLAPGERSIVLDVLRQRSRVTMHDRRI